MKICIVAGGRIPCRFYGGTERVVYWLVKELAGMGLEVTLVAPKGSSHAQAHRVITFRKTGNEINRCPPDIQSLIPADIDLVHIHFAYKEKLSIPALKTVHGYPFHYTGRKVYARPEEFDGQTSFVSDAHRRVCGLPENPFIHNGLDPDEYLFQREKNDYLLFLGKVDWNVKGLPLAMKIAQETKTRLVIAGDFLDPHFFQNQLKPRLSPLVSYAGPVDGQKKAGLLARAKALIFPTLWPEPFGLVAIEAMISGTPVLGTRNGALPEIIEHGRTGFLAARPSETIDQLGRIEELDPEACRSHVLKRFTSRIMARNYLELYKRIIALHGSH
ncbi:glycosyltransferase family 4 protein [Desulfonatronovibrio hydrogenovorans]|uniref:glycosyltransferase family 4 protein n=1 Tax=Desulfonatronovibrio hydrogenovorans TaxID=53245 RepID=UPI00048A9359|nr:glycosyltransferase family 4 protein [Desulfonatronovibrio hydrogenovorans]